MNVYAKQKVKVVQSCPTLWDPMGYTVHGILQATILEWVAFPFSGGSSQPMDWTQVSHIVGKFFTSWATWEAPNRLTDIDNKPVVTEEVREGVRDKLGVWEWKIQTIMHKIDKQQGYII